MIRWFIAVAAIVFTATSMHATEPNPSREQRALIDRLLQSMSIDETLKASVDGVFGQIEEQFMAKAEAEGGDPDDVAEAKEMFADFRSRSGKIDFSGLLHESFVRLYAKYFTEDEIRDLVAFYASNTGQKMVRLTPELTRDAMKIGMTELGPKIDEVLNETMAAQEKKKPWERTLRDMRSVATAVEAYSIDNEDLYPTGDYPSLKDVLVPDYISKWPERDVWGHGYAYVVSEDRDHYRIVSSASDSVFEWDSKRIVPQKDGVEPVTQYRDHAGDDLIYQDGSLLQAPVQARPKTKK